MRTTVISRFLSLSLCLLFLMIHPLVLKVKSDGTVYDGGLSMSRATIERLGEHESSAIPSPWAGLPSFTQASGLGAKGPCMA